MAYDDVKKVFGRQPTYILELLLDFCSNEYGDAVRAPFTGFCTADLGPGEECFKTFPNCQDEINFDKANLDINPEGPVTSRTYRFSNKRLDQAQNDGDPATFPTIKSVTMAPTKLDPNKGLGDRSSVKITVQDMPWTDRGIDPYVDTRTYNPDTQGSFWGRMLNRNKFYEGRKMKILTGYLEPDGTYDPANFIERLYIITRIAGPDYAGNVIVEGKDPLKLADDDRAQFPPAPKASVDGDITDVQTVFDYVDNGSDLVTWCDIGGPSEQPYVRIDNEIMLVTALTATEITATRATMPSFYDPATNEAKEHSNGAGIQQCKLYEDERIDDVYYNLLTEGANVDPGFLPLSDWQDVIEESGYQGYILNRLLAESKGVKEYLIELTKHNVYIWWDERDQEVKMGTLLPGSAPEISFNEDDNIIEGSITRTFDTKSRINEFWIGYAHRNPTADETKDFNLSEWIIPVNLTSQSLVENNDRKLRKVRSLWLARAQQAVATEISNRSLIDGLDAKRVITLELDPKDDAQWTDDIVSVNTRLVQDDEGNNLELNYQILEVNEKLAADGVTYAYLLKETTSFLRTGVIAPDCNPEALLLDEGIQIQQGGEDICDEAMPDYPDASDALRAQYIFIAYDHAPDPPADVSSPPGFNDGTPAYQIQ